MYLSKKLLPIGVEFFLLLCNFFVLLLQPQVCLGNIFDFDLQFLHLTELMLGSVFEIEIFFAHFNQILVFVFVVLYNFFDFFL